MKGEMENDRMFAQSAKIPSPCALKASFQNFGRGMRTYLRYAQ